MTLLILLGVLTFVNIGIFAATVSVSKYVKNLHGRVIWYYNDLMLEKEQ